MGSGFPLIWVELLLGFCVPVGWGLWQLRELRRLKREDEARDLAQARAAAQARAQAAAESPAPPADRPTQRTE